MLIARCPSFRPEPPPRLKSGSSLPHSLPFSPPHAPNRTASIASNVAAYLPPFLFFLGGVTAAARLAPSPCLTRYRRDMDTKR